MSNPFECIKNTPDVSISLKNKPSQLHTRQELIRHRLILSYLQSWQNTSLVLSKYEL